MAVIPLGKRGKHYALREDLKLGAIARLLWFHRWILLSAVLASGALSFGLFYTQDRIYETALLLELNVSEDRILGAKSKYYEEESTAQSNIEDTIVFLTSNFILKKLAIVLDLYSDSEFVPSTGQPDVAEDVSLRAFANEPGINAALGSTVTANLLDRLDIRQLGGSNVISIAATSVSPMKAARIANSLAVLYLEHLREARKNRNNEAIEVLEERIDSLRGEVAGLEGQIIAYKVDHAIEDFNSDRLETNAVTVQRAELATQLALAKVGLAEAQARRQQFPEKLDASDGGSAPFPLISPALRELRATETEILRRKSQFIGEFGTRHPLMINLDEDLAVIRDRMQYEIVKIRQNLGNEVSVNRARAAELQAQIALLDSKATTQEQARIGLVDLQQRSQISRALLQDLLRQHQLQLQQRQLDRAVARVMSPATIPTEPVYPKIELSTGIAAFAALALASLCIFFCERWIADFGFTTMEQLRDFDLVPLGVVPDLKDKEADGSSVEDYVLLYPQSAQSEAIRRIRTKLLQLEKTNGTLGQVLLVTSSMPDEGKTSTSIILARQAAAAGIRTLLIDADLRRPRVHEALRLANESGLTEILTGSISEGHIIQRDPNTQLDVLAAGQDALSPADLFRSDRMSALVNELRRHFEWIVIDSPPIGAVADGLVLSTHVDVCIFVARWRATIRSTILSNVRQLLDVGAPLAGVVLSRVDLDTQAKYGDVDFGQHYGRYHERPAPTTAGSLQFEG